MLTCLALTAAVSSCLSDDDKDNNYTDLTPAQRAAQIYEMSGLYTGYIYAINDTTMKTDSIPCEWRIIATDSSLVVNNFPVSIARYGISNVTAREILNSAGTQSLRAVLHPYNNTAFDKGYYTFTILPDNYKLSFVTEYEGKQHDVELNLTYQLNSISYAGIATVLYAVGEYYAQQMNAYILIKDVKIDDATYTTGSPTYIYGKK
ncbi:MAG: DUF4840 domain-containing protein [Prevotella sp.]|nr:DUF4840 domain-containing protein [Prevotella sp.]